MQAREDLLQPTLTEADDLDGIQDPWSPQMLVILALLGGPFGAGVLIGLNYRRLGMPERVLPTILSLWLLGVAIATVCVVVLDWKMFHMGGLEERRIARFVGNAIAVVVALAAVRPQKKRFDLWLASGNEPGSLWRPGWAGFLLGNAANYLVVNLVAKALEA